MSRPLQFIIGKLRDFAFDVLKPNTTNSDDPKVPILITSTNEQKILSRIEVDINEKDSAVWLFGTVGFTVNSSIFPGFLTFEIWRGKPNKGALIFSTTDTAQGGNQNFTSRNTSFTTTDYFKYSPCHKITYYLAVTAELTSFLGDPIDLRFTGPITFLASTIQN